MTNFYSYQGQEPQELPNEITLSTGQSRTDSSSFTSEEILDAGFTGPYTIPHHDSNSQYLEWDSNVSQFNIIDIPLSEKMKKIRSGRNSLLFSTDWMLLEDSPLTENEKLDIMNYRQTLRDFTQNLEDLDNIVWPEKPSFIEKFAY
jgi:hypothetical protein